MNEHELNKSELKKLAKSSEQNFSENYNKYREYFEKTLNSRLNLMRNHTPSEKLFSAMEYSLRGGGKRLRPVLYLAVYDFLTGNNLLSENLSKEKKCCGLNEYTDNGLNKKLTEAEKVACAIEMLHTYTLIHDDLPCLDNDDFRRGRPSCHKMFGEATALLAGDALLNHSLTLLLDAVCQNASLTGAAHEFSVLSGYQGVIGGQTVEIETMQNSNTRAENCTSEAGDCIFGNISQPEKSNRKDSLKQTKKTQTIQADMFQNNSLNCSIPKELFISIYKNKTAALFKGSALLAAGSAGRQDLNNILANYAENFGLAFQLKDDLNDNNKESFTHFFGKKETADLVDYYSENARKTAKQINCDFLLKLVDFEKFI